MVDKNNEVAKRIVSEFLGFLKDKVDNDRVTLSDLDSVAGMIKENMDVRGTAEDFARFYGQSIDNVRHVLHNKVLDTPVRRVYHSFARFVQAVPASWRKGKGGAHEKQMIET